MDTITTSLDFGSNLSINLNLVLHVMKDEMKEVEMDGVFFQMRTCSQ